MPRKAGVDSVEFFLHNEQFLDLAAEKLLRNGWPDRGFNYKIWIQEMGNLLEGVNNDVNDPSQNEWNGPFVLSVSKIRKILNAVFDEAQKKAVVSLCGGMDKVILYCKTAIEKKIEQTESFWKESHYHTYGVAYAAKCFFVRNLPTGEWSTPPGSQGYLAGEIAHNLNEYYNFPRINNGHPYYFERMVANAFIESEEGRAYLEELVDGDTEGVLDKKMGEKLMESRKLQITESDFRAIVNSVKRAINEGNFGYAKGNFGIPDTDSEFQLRDDDDDPAYEIGDDEKKNKVEQIASHSRIECKNFLAKYERESKSLNRWMDSKAITEPEKRKQIMGKLLSQKGIRLPSIVDAFYNEDTTYGISDMDNKYWPGFGWSRSQNHISVADEETWRPIMDEIMKPGKLEDIIAQTIDKEVGKKNDVISKHNASARESIAKVKQDYPEVFNGQLQQMSYTELRDYAHRIWKTDQDRHLENLRNTGNYTSYKMDDYLKQVYEMVFHMAGKMEAQAEYHNLGWANGWREGDESSRIADWLASEHQKNNPKVIEGICGSRASRSSGNCVTNEGYVVLDDNGNPKDIYAWAVDSSD